MSWPKLISEDYVLVRLCIKHPRFGFLDVEKFQRQTTEMQEKKADAEDDSGYFLWNGDWLTIKEITHYPETTVVPGSVILEHYIVVVDWTGY